MTLYGFYNFDLDNFKEHEYDAQLFGFTVEHFMTAIKLLVKEKLTKYTEVMTEALIKKFSDAPVINQVRETTKSLVDLYLFSSTDLLYSLEVQLKKLLHIPSNVLLPGDTVQRTHFSIEDEREVDEQLKDLLKRIKRTKSLNLELRQELSMLREALPILNKQVKEYECLTREYNESIQVFEDQETRINEIIDERLQLLNSNKTL